jgi:hypothetical protein
MELAAKESLMCLDRVMLVRTDIKHDRRVVTARNYRKGKIKVAHKQNTDLVPLFEIFEITFQHDREYENPFFDAGLSLRLTSPSGKTVDIGGFHYGSDEKPVIGKRKGYSREYGFKKANLWKARFVKTPVPASCAGTRKTPFSGFWMTAVPSTPSVSRIAWATARGAVRWCPPSPWKPRSGLVPSTIMG